MFSEVVSAPRARPGRGSRSGGARTPPPSRPAGTRPPGAPLGIAGRRGAGAGASEVFVREAVEDPANPAIRSTRALSTSAKDGCASRSMPSARRRPGRKRSAGAPAGGRALGSSRMVRLAQESAMKTRWRSVSTKDHSPSTRSCSAGSGSVRRCVVSAQSRSTVSHIARKSSESRSRGVGPVRGVAGRARPRRTP